jgi:hypothetical protein
MYYYIILYYTILILFTTCLEHPKTCDTHLFVICGSTLRTCDPTFLIIVITNNSNSNRNNKNINSKNTNNTNNSINAINHTTNAQAKANTNTNTYTSPNMTAMKLYQTPKNTYKMRRQVRKNKSGYNTRKNA